MRESGSGSRISQIISRHINSLDRGNGTGLGGSNTLLEFSQISTEGRLVTDSRRDTTQKSGHLRTSLGESENVINEQQHILSLRVTEVLGDSQTSQGDTGTGTRGLVRLTVHKGSLGARLSDLDDTRLNHFVKIVTLTSTLSDT